MCRLQRIEATDIFNKQRLSFHIENEYLQKNVKKFNSFVIRSVYFVERYSLLHLNVIAVHLNANNLQRHSTHRI